MTTAEQLTHHEAEVRRLKAELDAERGLKIGHRCWVAHPDGDIECTTYHPLSNVPQFPYTDDGKRKAERAAKMMASLNFEDPPFEVGQEVWMVYASGEVVMDWWEDNKDYSDLWHQGRIHATEAEALAWRDEFNGAWVGK